MLVPSIRAKKVFKKQTTYLIPPARSQLLDPSFETILTKKLFLLLKKQNFIQINKFAVHYSTFLHINDNIF